MTRPRVLLADDHKPVLQTVARLLEPGYEVVAAVRDGQAAIDATEVLRPEVVVLDISMPVLSGIDVAKYLEETGSPARIVFLTVHEDADFAGACLAIGLVSYVIKSRLASDLLPALEETLAGRSFVSPSLSLGRAG